MKHFIAAFAWLLFFADHAVAGQLADASSPKAYKDMTFSVFVPCAGNASFCAPTVLAKGVVTADSARSLQSFVVNGRKLPNSDQRYLANYTRVCFDSPGGSLEGGVKLGQVIRKMKLDTCLAPDYDESDNPASDAFHDKGAVCASACVLAFAGGMNRSVEERSRLGVHQFYSSSGQIGDSATQATVVQIAEYLEGTGVSRRLLDLASLVPAQKIFWLNASEVKSVRLDNTSQILNPWKLQANADGTLVAWVTQPTTQSDDANVTQLMLMRTSSGPVLVMRGEYHNRFAANTSEGVDALNPSEGRANVWFEADGRRILSRVVRWQSDSGGQAVITSMRLSQSEAQALASAKSLRFVTSCPHSSDQYALDTDVSTEGAGGIFRAVLRP
jgi:hypothetical protein